MNSSIDYAKLSKANVYLRNELAGHLEKLPNGHFQFSYYEDWIKKRGIPIGFAFPISSSPAKSGELFPFFDNLIPEGWLLKSVEAIYKIDKHNRFAVLLATGRETIGAIKLIPLDASGKEYSFPLKEAAEDSKDEIEYEITFRCPNQTCPYCLKKMTDAQIKKGSLGHDKCIKEMWGTTRKLKLKLNAKDPLASFRRTIKGASISGAQRKGLFRLDKDLLQATSFNSRYILKPNGEFPHLPENEHLTMAIAKAVGFEVPPFTIFHHEKLGHVYAVKRFDITDKGDHLRLEDTAQILGYSVDDKYDATYNQLAEAIRSYSDAIKPDLVEMWRRLIFCFLTANGDMHLKNWGFLEQGSLNGVFRLSPCYDLLNTRLPIPDEDIDIGLWLYEGKRKLTRELFLKFATELSIESFALKEIAKIDLWFETAKQLCKDSYLPEHLKTEYIKLVEERYQILKG
jgi:serine/threonine-protein kinase HipA